MKKRLFLTIALLLLILLTFTNAVAGDVVVIKVYEGGLINPQITVSIKDKTTVIKLESGKNGQEKRSEATAKILEQYLNEGYRIETSNALQTDLYSVTTYILTK